MPRDLSRRLTAGWPFLVALVLCGLGAAAGAAPPPRAHPSEHQQSLVPGATYGVRVFRDSEGIPQNSIQTIALDREGRLWVGTQDGAAFYDGRTWTAVDLPTRGRSNYVRVILLRGDGSLWFGTQTAGLCRLLDGQWQEIDQPGVPGGALRVNTLLETAGADGRRALWVGTHDQGLARLNEDGWTTFDSKSGLPSDRIWALCEATDDKGKPVLWVGTQAGLACLRSSSPGFEVRPEFPREPVNSIVATPEPDGSQALWAGTYGGGLARMSHGVWRTLRTHDGLPSDFVTSLAWKGVASPVGRQ